jgi:hypothetical protein
MRVSCRRRLCSTSPRCLRARHHPLLHLLHVLHVLLHAGHLAHHAGLPGLPELRRLRLRRGALGYGEACRGDRCNTGSKGK